MSGIRCMLMRGGTSKGAYFLASDPLTSKVAIVGRSVDAGADVDYLFLQVGVDTPTVSDRQTCGNLLAGVGPFAVERGLVPPGRPVRIRMVNTGEIATAAAGGHGTELVLGFGTSGVLLPTGNVRDEFGGIAVTCVNAGMPVVVVEASSLGRTGREPVSELEADAGLLERVTALRLEAGKAMGLGDVSSATVPKVSLVGLPSAGGTVSTRTFIPVRVHEAIGVLGAVSVAAALLIEGAAGHRPDITGPRLLIEHPTGATPVEVELDTSMSPPAIKRSGLVRTARELFDGTVFPHEKVIPR